MRFITTVSFKLIIVWIFKILMRDLNCLMAFLTRTLFGDILCRVAIIHPSHLFIHPEITDASDQ